MKILKCPNGECRYAEGSKKFFVKRGYFMTRWNNQPVPRYRCKGCGRFFSSHTFRRTWRQKKPFLNDAVFRWYCSGATQRRMAKVLRINRKTVVRKFRFLTEWARTEHEQWIREGRLKTEKAQFDEMESFVHSRLKPVSIALAVNETTGKILDVSVATMPCHGKRAAVSRAKYGFRHDHRPRARRQVLQTIARCAPPNLQLTSDPHPTYARLVKQLLPEARYRQVKSRSTKARSHFIANRRNQHDPLFTLNFTAAKIRHDLSRMARRVWVTTKRARYLQAHLDLYIAFHNGYSFTESAGGLKFKAKG
jgi:transposase-like protein